MIIPEVESLEDYTVEQAISVPGDSNLEIHILSTTDSLANFAIAIFHLREAEYSDFSQYVCEDDAVKAANYLKSNIKESLNDEEFKYETHPIHIYKKLTHKDFPGYRLALIKYNDLFRIVVKIPNSRRDLHDAPLVGEFESKYQASIYVRTEYSPYIENGKRVDNDSLRELFSDAESNYVKYIHDIKSIKNEYIDLRSSAISDDVSSNLRSDTRTERANLLEDLRKLNESLKKEDSRDNPDETE